MLLKVGFTSWRGLAGAIAVTAVSGAPAFAENAKANAPIPSATLALMAAKNTSPSAPVHPHLQEGSRARNLETREGRALHPHQDVSALPLVGPARAETDARRPSGAGRLLFDRRRQMNPNSHDYLSFDIGFPNVTTRRMARRVAISWCTAPARRPVLRNDRQANRRDLCDRARSFRRRPAGLSVPGLSVPHERAEHGQISHSTRISIFGGSSKKARTGSRPTGEEPIVKVVDGRYTFAPSRDPEKEKAAQAFHAEEEEKIASLISDGSAAIRTTYFDGGQHPAFAALSKQGADLGDVSRPEALAFAGQEVIVVPSRKKKVVFAQAKAAEPPPEPAGKDACIALPIRSIGAEDLLFSPRPLGCGRAQTVSGSLMATGASRILPPPFEPPALESRRR